MPFIKQVSLTSKTIDENFILFIIHATEFSENVKTNSLLGQLQNIQSLYNGKQVCLLVCGLRDYCRQYPKQLKRLTIEKTLTELQILANISHRLLDTSADLANVVMQFSKSIAEFPYKLVVIQFF